MSHASHTAAGHLGQPTMGSPLRSTQNLHGPFPGVSHPLGSPSSPAQSQSTKVCLPDFLFPTSALQSPTSALSFFAAFLSSFRPLHPVMPYFSHTHLSHIS